MPESKTKRPRAYLSYSAMSLLEKSEKQFIERYLEGMDGFQNDAMRFGSYVADELEKGESDDPQIQFLLTFLPNAGRRERTITVPYKKMKLLVRLDSSHPRYKSVREYKTGKVPWTQGKVDKNDQLTFYAMTLWVKTNKIPRLWLDWLPTHINEDGDIELTREIKSFRTERSVADILKMLVRAERAWKRIGELAEIHSR